MLGRHHSPLCVLGTRESMNALKKRILGLVVKDTDERPQATLYLDGNVVISFPVPGTSFTMGVVIEGHSYLLEIELEDIDVGIYTCFLYLIFEEKGEIAGHPSVSRKIDFDNFLIIPDVSQTFDPDKVSQHWDVMVVVRANVNVHVCDLYKPMNKMQAEAQGRHWHEGRGYGPGLVIEAVEATSAIPIDADGKEIDL